jgi:hypothetical protein
MWSEIHISDDLNDGAERWAVVNLECGVAEKFLPSAGEAGQLVKFFNRAAQCAKKFIAGELRRL